MRAWGLAVFAIGAAGVAMAQRATPPTPAPGRLARPGALYLIVVEDGAARCQRWDVVPGAAGQGQLTREVAFGGEVGAEWLDFEINAGGLSLTGRGRTVAKRAVSMTCTVPLPVSELDGALAVGASRWFLDAAGCAAALARHAPVAIDLRDCELEPLLAAEVRQATKRDFEALLRGGGDVYFDDDGRCVAAHVQASRQQPAGGASGQFWRPIVARGVRGRGSVGYRLLTARDELLLLGRSATFPDSSYGIGCLRQTHLFYGRGEVFVDRPLYLTRDGCRAAVRAAREREAWLPAEPSFDATPARTESIEAAEAPAPGETSPVRREAEVPAPGGPTSDDHVGLPVGC
ncbi:MAG: hypothetical protein IPH44_28740 [Myxococcales bacterium]|nr:hypothetical protein [Myxococcales bacterium]MBK7191404.1 hypothetical protein [Myxococcales bacterium]